MFWTLDLVEFVKTIDKYLHSLFWKYFSMLTILGHSFCLEWVNSGLINFLLLLNMENNSLINAYMDENLWVFNVDIRPSGSPLLNSAEIKLNPVHFSLLRDFIWAWIYLAKTNLVFLQHKPNYFLRCVLFYST